LCAGQLAADGLSLDAYCSLVALQVLEIVSTEFVPKQAFMQTCEALQAEITSLKAEVSRLQTASTNTDSHLSRSDSDSASLHAELNTLREGMNQLSAAQNAVGPRIDTVQKSLSDELTRLRNDVLIKADNEEQTWDQFLQQRSLSCAGDQRPLDHENRAGHHNAHLRPQLFQKRSRAKWTNSRGEVIYGDWVYEK
jgi:predicted  nucleic acid-binding Zn-ribbon protein